MPISKSSITRLAKQHPHSAGLLKAFVPLLDVQTVLADVLPLTELPELDAATFAQGKAWLPALQADKAYREPYLDPAFLKAAVRKITSAAAKGLPDAKERIRELGSWLAKHPDDLAELVLLRLTGKTGRIPVWAKKRGWEPELSELFATNLAAASARRVAKAAATRVLPAWHHGTCPVCGSRPHAGSLQTKEGKRFLHCSLCRHEWQFSRTTCPVCEQSDPRKIPLFFLEDNRHERAEGCDACKHYLLSVDMREFSSDTPLEAFLLCMMPLDLLMQEKKYIPAVSAG